MAALTNLPMFKFLKTDTDQAMAEMAPLRHSANDLQKQGATMQAEVAKMRDRMEALTRENRREAAKQTVPDNDQQGFGIESAITQFSARQSSLPAVADADRPVAE